MGEDAVRARHPDFLNALFDQQLAHFHHRTAGGDFIIVYQGALLAGQIAHKTGQLDVRIREALLDAGGHGQFQILGEAGGLLGLAQIGGHQDGIRQVALGEEFMQNLAAAQRVGGHAEEAVHLGRVQHHGHDVGGAGRLQQVGDQACGDRDARGVLLIGAGKGKIRDDGMHFGGRRAAGRVQHDQQFDQVIVDRRKQGLDDENLARTHAGAELNVQVVVAEAPDTGGLEGNAQVSGDIRCQLGVRTAAEKTHFVGIDADLVFHEFSFLPERMAGFAGFRRAIFRRLAAGFKAAG